ncbi:MAG TPA: ATP-binding protein [Pyrinomonadaceae bacterium]|jgi:PAS domain S-box-containing protein|nr:ATP-binding protein [Pyrinomonadaceae bacterium]
MQTQDVNSLLENLPDDSPLLAGEAEGDLLTAAFSTFPDAVYLFGGDRRLIKANSAAARLQDGVTAPGTACCEMFWHVGGADTCVVDRALQTLEKVEVEIQASPDDKNSISIIVEPLQRNGLPPAALVIARDISDLRRAEAEAIAHKSFLASIADRTPDEIYALDTNCRITWMNERAQTYKTSMSPSNSFLDLVSPDSRDLTEVNLQRTLKGDDTQHEVRVTGLDGSIRHTEAHTSPLWKNGEIVGALVFLRDITDRKREHELMAQSDKLRAVGELAAGVAHNLNNSLTVIQGRAQLLLRNATDEVSSKSLQVITNAVEDGTKTLRRILEFARRDSASEFAPVELNYLITSSIDIARPKWQSKSRKGTIEVKVEGGNSVYVMGEQAELREVVLNLIFNAVDAMPDGGVMEIGARAEIESGCFWVADSGCGMPPETALRIFEPFFTTKGKLGSGLGLSASHGIITRHKGEILVVSEPGDGTRFEVRLAICDKADRFVKSNQPEPNSL